MATVTLARSELQILLAGLILAGLLVCFLLGFIYYLLYCHYESMVSIVKYITLCASCATLLMYLFSQQPSALSLYLVQHQAFNREATAQSATPSGNSLSNRKPCNDDDECDICTGRFSTDATTKMAPIVLPCCGQTYCRGCLDQVDYKCPICQQPNKGGSVNRKLIHVLTSIRADASTKDAMARLANNPDIVDIAQLIEFKRDDVVIVKNALCQLWSLCNSTITPAAPHHRVEAGRYGVPFSVIKAMRVYRTDVDVQHWGCGALTVLMTGNHENRTEIRHHGGLGRVVEAMESFKGNQDVQRIGCAAVQNILYGKKAGPVNRQPNNILRVALAAMKEFPGDCLLQGNGLGALVNLISYGYESGDADIFCDGGIGIIVAAMKRRADDADCVWRACWLLYKMLSSAGDASIKLVMVKAGSQAVIQQAMGKHPGHAGVQQAGRKALEYISSPLPAAHRY